MIARLIGLCFMVSLVTTLPQGRNQQDLWETDYYDSSSETSEDSDECICIPFYQCTNGSILTDGSGLLDVRVAQCPKSTDVCCKMPLDKDKLQMPPPKKRNGCGQRNPDGIGNRITGPDDNEARFGEFPWMTALFKKTVESDGSVVMKYTCGGSLIHEKVVLTAAHCVSDKDNVLIARAGDWNIKINNEEYPHKNEKVARVIIHPGFREAFVHNDFALLILENPFPLGENIGTVCLPDINHVPLSRECYASGWGSDKYGDEGHQAILKKVDLPIVPKDQCVDLLRKTRLGRFFKLHESFVCAGGVVGKDTCKGDGGGPLVCPRDGMQGTYELTGIVSWGIGCGTENPGVYGNVAYARQWIDTELSSHGIRLNREEDGIMYNILK